jgi:ribosomal protein L11 methyltransferase
MDYIKVTFPKQENQTEAEIFISKLVEKGFESFEETEEELYAYIPVKDYDENLITGTKPLSVETLKDQNWNAVWESNYNPVMISGKVFIRAPFHSKNQNAEYDVVIDPKMAFGTAHHETTALMITYILQEKDNIKGKSILDMGCGTGVLAILCALSGAKNVLAVDNDIWSVESSKENIVINNTPQVKVIQGDAKTLPDNETFDIILANINKNILLHDMSYYHNSLKHNGLIIFSGFYTNDVNDIEKRADKLGMQCISQKTKNNWTAVAFRKTRK